MIEYGTPRITDKLPVLTVDAPAITSLTPVDFADILYTPALLLRVPFDASITSSHEYQSGCESGYESYFEYCCCEMHYGREYRNTRSELCAFIGRNLMGDDDIPLTWYAGFCVGWLSALAFTDRPLALVGLDLLIVLVNRLQDHA